MSVVTAARRYRALFAVPGVARVALPSLIGRLPYGMATLLFILAIHRGTGSYALAGFGLAVHSAVTAATAPWLGRLADRGHARPVLITTGIGYATMLAGLVATLASESSAVWILVFAALAGALNPPVGAVSRVVLPGLAPSHASTAYALDAITVEFTFVLGPMMIAALLTVLDAYTALLFTGAIGAAGSLALATAPGLQARYATPAVAREGRLWSWTLAAVLFIGSAQAAAYGLMEVAIPSFAAEHGAVQLAGLLVALWSGGSIVGGIWFSGRTPRLSHAALYCLLLTLNTLGFAGMLLAFDIPSLGLLLFLGGLVIAPTTAVEGALVTALVPAGRATEAFTWVGSGIYLGFAVGSTVSGWLLDSGYALRSVNLVSVAVVLTACTLTYVLRSRPRSRQDQG